MAMKIALNHHTAPAQQVEPGRHIARIVQIVGVGLQRAFDPNDPPEQKLGIALELASGAVIARTVAINVSPAALLGQLIDAAGVDRVALAAAGRDLEPSDLLGRSVAVETEVRGGRWVKILSFGPLEAWDDAVEGTAETLAFDIDNPPADKAAVQTIVMQLHRDLREAISQRVRGGASA